MGCIRIPNIKLRRKLVYQFLLASQMFDVKIKRTHACLAIRYIRHYLPNVFETFCTMLLNINLYRLEFGFWDIYVTCRRRRCETKNGCRRRLCLLLYHHRRHNGGQRPLPAEELFSPSSASCTCRPTDRVRVYSSATYTISFRTLQRRI